MVKQLHHQRVVQQMELLIVDAQIAQLTGYIMMKEGGPGAPTADATERRSLPAVVVKV